MEHSSAPGNGGIAAWVSHAAAPLPTGAINDLADTEVWGALSTLERVVNVAQAAQAELMAEAARRAECADRADEAQQGRPLMPTRSEFVADELAAHLATTKVDASRRYGLALSATDHPGVQRRWRRGALSMRKVQVICEGLTDVSSPAVESLAEQASHYAETHTAPELRRWLSRRVIAADPGMAEIRRARAVADRRVTVTPLPDGVSELYALLPSVQARQIFDTVNALAHTDDATDEDLRTIEQRRVDALIDLLVGRAEPPQVNVQVVVSADTLLGECAGPAHVAGVGPITSTEALDLVNGGGHDTAFRRMLTDPETGFLVDISERQYRPSAPLERAVRARDGVCRFPGCCRPASTKRSGTDLDHTIPWPRGQTTAANLAVLCRHHHLLKHSPGWLAELHADGSMQWTSPSGSVFRTEPWSYDDPG